MFEWADGGNLHDLWNSMKKPDLEPSLIKGALKQLSGLAAALRAAHNLDSGASYRHGDLKPANILWFRDGTPLGKLKIGDWGEAKSHNLHTELRPSKTTAEYGTRRYEAPEVVTGLTVHFPGQATRRRSRLYDVWAMGCITLEFIVWLLYGIKTLEQFNRSIQEKDSTTSPFYKILDGSRSKVAEVHGEVIRWMDLMAQDPACRTIAGTSLAIGDLLDVVRNQLLVVGISKGSSTVSGESSLLKMRDHDPSYLPIRQDGLASSIVQEPVEIDSATGADVPSIAVTPAGNDSYVPPHRDHTKPSHETTGLTRATAKIFCDSLNSIVEQENEKDYWDVDLSQQTVPTSSGSSSAPLLCEDTSGGSHAQRDINSTGLSVPGRERVSLKT